ncbi:MAG: DoxX family protein [Bacteroidota bacterium]|nr:DoxX family protein [Bacteroidota bacterium]
MFKKITLGILCVLMGAVFIFSGYTKLYPIEPFEYTFVDLGMINWQLSPFVARLLIGLEFLIGILLIMHLHLRKVLLAGMLLLVIFSFYLLLLIFFTGNKGNCGCFGSMIEMTPLEAIIKNSMMLGFFLILYFFHSGWELRKRKRLLLVIPIALSFALPFILNPVALDYSEAYLNKPEENFLIELDTLYNNAKLNVPPKTLSEGKQIIVFMSLTCKHCKIAANKIRIMREKNPEIPFYFVLNGQEKNLESFFELTQTKDIPHCMLLGRSFVYLAGTSLPTIYMVNNSMVEHEIDYFTMDQKEIENWLKKK